MKGFNEFTANGRSILVADYAVAGAGTAGAAFAFYMTGPRTKGERVSVHLGEGGQRRNADPAVTVPSASNDPTTDIGASASSAYHWPYPAKGLVLATPSEPRSVFGGRMWGGSSGHNYLLTVRGTPGNYDVWGAVDPRWGYDALLPAMKALETYTDLQSLSPVNPAQRGTSGPLYVTLGSVAEVGAFPSSNAFAVALAANGCAWSADYNDPDRGVYTVGSSEQYTTPDPDPATFERSFAASAFLNADVVTVDGVGVGGRRLRLTSNAVALRLLFEDDFSVEERVRMNLGRRSARCSTSCRCCSGTDLLVLGVRYLLEDGSLLDVAARKKVVLCLGAIGDAALLQRSGIGPTAELEALGIEVRLANEHVGTELQNHYGPGVVMPYLGGAGDPAVTATGFFAPPSAPGSEGPRYNQGIFLINLVPEVIFVICGILNPSKNTRAMIDSRGAGSPLVTVKPYDSAEDQASALFILKKMRAICQSYAGQDPIEPDTATYDAGDEALLDYARSTATSGSMHFSGSCRMATSADTGVVDGALDVFGTKGLSVCSNAICPQINDGNTAYTAYVIGMTKAKIEGAEVDF